MLFPAQQKKKGKKKRKEQKRKACCKNFHLDTYEPRGSRREKRIVLFCMYYPVILRKKKRKKDRQAKPTINEVGWKGVEIDERMRMTIDNRPIDKRKIHVFARAFSAFRFVQPAASFLFDRSCPASLRLALPTRRMLCSVCLSVCLLVGGPFLLPWTFSRHLPSFSQCSGGQNRGSLSLSLSFPASSLSFSALKDNQRTHSQSINKQFESAGPQVRELTFQSRERLTDGLID